ncbi:uncharacterized protein LOC126705573 [Quercus robur]|uniref:uncharacterized protein LOC126705573 n=1 Tax=Quercus robur TaxID=38942 RepID=UPI0021623AB8|nr:uncharacterized protein LOC126705573 [Quercus robur]
MKLFSLILFFLAFFLLGTSADDVTSVISSSLFNKMLKYRNDPRCKSNGFYTYNAFVDAAKSFNGFGTTGDITTRKREIAAFFGQTSHETTGGWPSAPDGPYAWGYCLITETNKQTYCTPSNQWPCAPGKQYYGRGPIQLTHNYNYGPAGKAIGVNLLSNPDQVATNPTISFKTAIWFWMTPQGSKPSSHNVITGKWKPSAADTAAGRVPGYGVITNIINGGIECGHGQDSRVADRIGFYKRYSDILGVSYGNNLDCYNQKPFAYPHAFHRHFHLTNREDLETILKVTVFLNKEDNQVRAAHKILRYDPIQKSFAAPKHVIRANDPRLQKITVAKHGFLIFEGSLVPEGIPLSHAHPPFTSTKHYCCTAFTLSKIRKMKLFSLILFFLAFFLLGTSADDVTSVINSALFDRMLKYRNDPRCKGNGFYTYNAFVDAAKSFNGFGTTGDITIRKRELAAFLGQTSHETTGGWATAPDGAYAWGYCFITETNKQAYCTPSKEWPCAPGKQYYGRGPTQLTHNYNYGPAGKAIGVDLLKNPNLVATNPTISFKTAIWFWMTPQGSKPSSHDVIIGKWKSSTADTAAGRVPGYGVITNIINGGLECGRGPDSRVADRIGFYKRYSDILGVSYGANLDCYNQKPFA